MLIVAAATGAEVWAGGRDALRCGSDYLFRIGGCVPALALRNAHAGLLAGQREWHKNGFALSASEECAAINGLFDFNQLLSGQVHRLARKTRKVGAPGVFELCRFADCFFVASLLAHIEEAEARKIVVDQQLLLHELLFYLAQLHGAHAAAIGRQFASRMLL